MHYDFEQLAIRVQETSHCYCTKELAIAGNELIRKRPSVVARLVGQVVEYLLQALLVLAEGGPPLFR